MNAACSPSGWQWDDQCESEHGVRRRVWAAGASRPGASGVLAALAQGSAELSVVSRCAGSSPAVPSAQHGVAFWACGYTELGSGCWSGADALEQRRCWEAGRCSYPQAFSSIPQLRRGDKVDKGRLFVFLRT